MFASASTPNREEFDQWVRGALNNLYDISYLQSHPLADLLGDEGKPPEKSQRLREALLEAIESMRPPSGVRAHSSGWRAYRILELRYIDGFSPKETMSELALGRSQFFKAQAKVLEAVSNALWLKMASPAQPEFRSQESANAQTDHISRKDAALEEMARLRSQTHETTINLVQVLDDLRPLTNSLATIRAVDLRYTSMQDLNIAHADRVMTRQAVLNVITYALDLVPGGQVEVMSFREGREIGIWVVAVKTSEPISLTPGIERQGVGLEVGQQLMAAMRGVLRVSATEQGHWVAHLVWSTSEVTTILVVDDNQDFADLVSRYLIGFNCQLVRASRVADAKTILKKMIPTLIISDVMMPNEDGWEFLAAVKAAPETADIPFFTCSALSEPQLSAMLGATAHLTKPLTQKALLRALAPWLQAIPAPVSGRQD